ncbi:hypothetical protein AAC387_Pa06g0982 [Persea americana]
MVIPFYIFFVSRNRIQFWPASGLFFLNRTWLLYLYNQNRPSQNLTVVVFFSGYTSSVVRSMSHRGHTWVRQILLVTASSLRTTRFRTRIFSFLFLPLLRTKFENQESPSSLSFFGKQQQQSSGFVVSLDRLSTPPVTGKTMPYCLLLPPRPRKLRRRPAKVRAAAASLSSPSLFSFSGHCTKLEQR